MDAKGPVNASKLTNVQLMAYSAVESYQDATDAFYENYRNPEFAMAVAEARSLRAFAPGWLREIVLAARRSQ